jgi:fucose permease
MGKISDASNIQRAFIVPLICYLYVIYFAVSGYQPEPTLGAVAQPTAIVEAK